MIICESKEHQTFSDKKNRNIHIGIQSLVEHTNWVYVCFCFWSSFDCLLCLILTDELINIQLWLASNALLFIWAWSYINYTSCYFEWELFFVFSVRKQHCRLWRLVIGILKEHLISFIANPSLKHLLILDTWRSYTIDIKVSNGCENKIETLIAFKMVW